jgi:hypothetical protein
MTRDELIAASESLNNAAEGADDELSAKLSEQADTLATLADREKGPDHGRLAKIEHSLRSLKESASDEGADLIDDALTHIKEYRKTVEGV